MKSIPIASALCAAVAMAAGLGPAHAADACKDVKFYVTNDHFEEREIEIRSVKFRNPHNGNKVQSEDVKNKVCKHGATCLTDGDNLGNANNIDLDDIQIVFRHRNHDGTWSKEFITQPFSPKVPRCEKGKHYGPAVVRDSQ